MIRNGVLAAGVSAAALGAVAAYGAANPPPVTTYWMDAATASGMGAGMTAGTRPSMDQIMGMMSGQSSVARTLELTLASRTKPAAAPQADHLIPPGLAMGPSLPLISPDAPKPVKETYGLPQGYEKPKGRMLIYWGCGERVSAGQPTVLDFAKLASGQVPPGMAALANIARTASPPSSAAGFGQWPNKKDSRAVPANGSLVGAHKVQANYAPPIDFTLAQDFMPALGLTEAGTTSAGAARLRWTPAASATGYALMLSGANQSGDIVMWTSAKSAAMMPHLDYLSPAEVKRQIAVGIVLPAATSECLLPAEVASSVPVGMVMAIGYGPEVHFAEKSKAPKWTTKVRYKTTASLMRGMGAMGGMTGAAPQTQQQPGQTAQPQRKKKRFGLGDILKGAIPVPVP